MKEVFFLISSILVVSGLFVGRFVLLRDAHPNTELLLKALRALGPAQDEESR